MVLLIIFLRNAFDLLFPIKYLESISIRYDYILFKIIVLL